MNTAPSNWTPRTHTESLAHKEVRKIWMSVRDRCVNPRHSLFKIYGARGVKIAAAWHEFENFFKDMGPRPSIFHRFELISPSLVCGPGFCRWSTRQESLKSKPIVNPFMRSGRFDWDAWRAAGAPETP